MKEFIQLMAALLGSLGFAALFNIRGKKLIFATIGGFLSWATYLAAACINANPYFCGFISTVLTTLYAEVMARMVKTPVTVFLVSATIQLSHAQKLCRLFQRRNLHPSLRCQHVCWNYFYHCGFPYDLASALQQQKHTYPLKN